MGEVYRARDSRLGREVALKILPPDMASDPSRRRRFELEARAVAALNHPNIVALYDVGEGYIVNELVDGEPLSGVKLGLRKAIDAGVQIAAGLAAAHAAGITHRDLKPANILLTRDGRVKILDFGLAKVAEAHSAAGTTETMSAKTEPGAVMGTVGYMSPEQVRGMPTDHRSDIFSFGLVLYELLAGKRAFVRDSSIETMNAILKEEPAELPEMLPLGVRMVVARCLEKDPDNRFQSAKDLGFALAQSGMQSGSKAVVKPSPRRRMAAWMAAVAGIAGAVGVGHFLWRSPLPPVWTAVGDDPASLAWLPMGKKCSAHVVPADRMAEISGWAPDGNKIYFDRALDTPRGIYSVPVLGGEEQLVLEDAMYPESLPDGSLLTARLNAEHKLQLFRFWPQSGKEQAFPLQVDLPTTAPQVRAFPDGRHAVVIGTPISQGAEPGKEMYVLDLDSGKMRRLLERGGLNQIKAPAVTRDGRTILFADQLLHGVPIPVRTARFTSTRWSGRFRCGASRRGADTR